MRGNRFTQEMGGCTNVPLQKPVMDMVTIVARFLPWIGQGQGFWSGSVVPEKPCKEKGKAHPQTKIRYSHGTV